MHGEKVVARGLDKDVGVCVASKTFLHKPSVPGKDGTTFTMSFNFSPLSLTISHVGSWSIGFDVLKAKLLRRFLLSLQDLLGDKLKSKNGRVTNFLKKKLAPSLSITKFLAVVQEVQATRDSRLQKAHVKLPVEGEMPKKLVFIGNYSLSLSLRKIICIVKGTGMSDHKARGLGSWLNLFSVMSVTRQSKSSPCSGTYLIISMAALILVLPSMGWMGMANPRSVLVGEDGRHGSMTLTPSITILAQTADTPRKLVYNTWLMRIQLKWSMLI